MNKMSPLTGKISARFRVWKQRFFDKGYLHARFRIWNVNLFFLTWRKNFIRKFFFGIIYVHNDELAELCIER